MTQKPKKIAMAKEAQKVKVGDVYVEAFEDGRRGAIRILKVSGKYVGIATTPYIGDKPPALTDPLLREILIEKRGKFNNKLSIYIFEGKKPDGIEYLGNIPLSKEEEKIDVHGDVGGFGYKGIWDSGAGYNVWHEWMNEHKPEAYREYLKASDEAERERLKKMLESTPKPSKLMPAKKFWAIIDLLNWDKLTDEDDEAVVAPAIEALSKMSTKDICKFEETLTYNLFKLDTKEHAKNIGEMAYEEGKYFSPDLFLYARCAVVANGSKLFNKVLRKPSEMVKDLDFEPLLYIAKEAYEMKTGEDFDSDTTCSYESFSNSEGWEE